MKAVRTDIIVVKGKSTPTVEIDTEASAAYVRFKRTKVTKTVRHRVKWPIVTIDIDRNGEVVGIEFIGVKKFNLGWLLKQVPLKAPSRAIDNANYISAESREVAA